MDYITPIETLIPGVQGRVLGVLTRTETELTMRTVAKLADVSVNRAVSVLNRLIGLGLVERRDVGSAALVRLDRDNEAAKVIMALGNLRQHALDRLQARAKAIRPAPASLIVFGSFARGEAADLSDLDVVAVRRLEVREDDRTWIESLGHWVGQASRIVGNPVNLLTVGEHEVAGLLRRQQSVWSQIAKEGIVLLGSGLKEDNSVAS
jgi:predicted nucleotidyltransferase